MYEQKDLYIVDFSEVKHYAEIMESYKFHVQYYTVLHSINQLSFRYQGNFCA